MGPQADAARMDMALDVMLEVLAGPGV